MRLLLIRHGQTPNNVLGALDTARPGAGLTELGREQARAVPEVLAAERIAALHVSALVRTQQTAAPLAAERGLTAQVTEGLEEISAGDHEMGRAHESVAAYQENLVRWGDSDFDHAIPSGEDGHTFFGRYSSALRAIAAEHPEDATVAVVSHGAAIRIYATIAAGLPLETLDDQPLYNTGMVVLTGHPDRGWELSTWINDPVGGAQLRGDTSHDVTADDTTDAVGTETQDYTSTSE
ncbi:histidine phosphatase family protein [Brachybacterium sacelli]|uniref:Phosphoglycerate mutase n=1 Tax=Brachybacterium sacelli TaxID=173364 RepID=A0ABS4WZN3_9MICO|nr:histidine phosphatase family protein [Brachybacterium sacelli]MBP2380949.1 putative phosphoglycerate mutase [Brachybacterium sacelli]